jgi:hypothetical protein
MVLMCTAAMDAVESELTSALVAMVGGTRPAVTPDHVCLHLTRHYQVDADSVRIHRYRSDGFLVNFSDPSTADRVLHASQPQGAELVLIFRHW